MTVETVDQGLERWLRAKNTKCFSKGLRFNSLIHTAVCNPIPDDRSPFSGPCQSMQHKHTYRQNTHKHMKKKRNC